MQYVLATAHQKEDHPIGYRQQNDAENTDLKHRSRPMRAVSRETPFLVKSAESDCLSVRCFGTIMINCRTYGRPRMPRAEDEMPGVKRERDDSVGILTLDEPATLNAMTPDLLGDLASAIGEMTDDAEIRALVLTGAGRGFCSGQNLKAARILGDDIVDRRDALLLAGVPGAARMPRAGRGRRQRRCRRWRV